MAHLISLRRRLPYGGGVYLEGQHFEAADKHAVLLVASGFARVESVLERNNRQMRAAPQPQADEAPPRRRAARRAEADAPYERRDLQPMRKSAHEEEHAP